jgi:hypothetical protein
LNVTIDLTPEEVAYLQAIAGKEGLELAEYAGRLVRNHLPLRSTEPTATNNESDEADPLSIAVARMTNRSPEDKAAARAHALATYQPRRTLPPGKTFSDVISGKWPGDETDEQINAALEELS